MSFKPKTVFSPSVWLTAFLSALNKFYLHLVGDLLKLAAFLFLVSVGSVWLSQGAVVLAHGSSVKWKKKKRQLKKETGNVERKKQGKTCGLRPRVDPVTTVLRTSLCTEPLLHLWSLWIKTANPSLQSCLENKMTYQSASMLQSFKK